MSTTNVRIQEAQHRTAQLLGYIIREAESIARVLVEANGNPYNVKMNRSDIIEGFTADYFTTTMTTTRYLENLIKNRQSPIIQHGITGKIYLNRERQRCYISIGENAVQMPKDPDFKPEPQPTPTEPSAHKSGKRT